MSHPWKKYGPVLVLLATALAYLPSLFNGFTNWDDPSYLLDNPLIRSLNADTFRQLFTGFTEGNYHPLTMLSYLVEYQIWGLDPFYYHVNNLVLHLVNTWLVYAIVRKLAANEVVALLTAALFGLHPMHVESVAWISERKDVLYACFYLAGILSYLKWQEGAESKQRKPVRWLIGVYGFFLMACLSKGMAVVFPVTLVLIDQLRDRLRLSAILRKAPLFVMSLAFGLIAIAAQKEASAIAANAAFDWTDRVLFASYNLLYYVKQFLFPTGLAAYHPYPLPGQLPVLMRWSPLLLLVLAGLLVYAVRRDKLLRFALLFFVVHLLLVIQLIPVGGTIAAERYTYLPYIGLGLGIAHVLLQAFRKISASTFRVALSGVAGLAVLLLAWNTYRQCHTWHDSLALWEHMQAVYPEAVMGYEMTGKAYMDAGEHDKAFAAYRKAVKRVGDRTDALIDLGFLYAERGEYLKAMSCYNEVLAHTTDVYQAYLGRGHVHFIHGRTKEALADFDRTLELAPALADGYANRAALYLKTNRPDEALADLNAALARDAAHAQARLTRANYFSAQGDYEPAREDYQLLLQQTPGHAEALHNLGFLHARQGDFREAIGYFSKAIHANPAYRTAYKNRGVAQLKLAEAPKAIQDFSKAIAIDPAYGNAYWYRAKAHALARDFQAALADAGEAESLGVDVDRALITSWESARNLGNS